MYWLLGILAFLLLILSIRVGVEVSGRNAESKLKLILAGLRFSLRYRAARPLRKIKEEEPEFAREINGLHALARGAAAVWEEFDLDDPKAMWRSLRFFARSFRLRVHQFDLTIASHDPALTGILYGSACAAQYAIPQFKHVRIFADFEQTRPELNYRIELSVIPLYFLFNSLRSFFALPLRKLIRIYNRIQSDLVTEERMSHV